MFTLDSTRIKNTAQRGFTLIEMAIVIMIVGVLIAAGGRAYVQYQKHLAIKDTKQDIASVNQAIEDFLLLNGRYPCPAPLTVASTSPEYGRETDCSDTTIAVGASGTVDGQADAFFITQSSASRTVDYTNQITGDPTVGARPRVRVGAIPFRNLGIEEEESYDGYRKRLMYVVTEQQAVAETFESDDGGIKIVNASGDDITSIPESAHFLVFSYGENEAGSYTYGGTRIPCATAGKESENCDIDRDNEYILAQTSTAGTSNVSQYDDIMVYEYFEEPLWQKSASTNPVHQKDIHIKKIGNVGLGKTASIAPNEEFQVDGVVRAQDDPDTPELEGLIQSSNICDYDSKSPTCFPSSLIAGQLAEGEGMSCPPGQFMIGIANGAPICREEVILKCPSGKLLAGIKSDGSLNCNDPPPSGCATANILLCDANQVLPASSHGARKTISAGISRVEKYRCRDGKWKRTYKSGICTCTTATGSTRTLSCETSRSSCGTKFAGTRQIQSQFICPQARWINVEINNGCTCVETRKTREVACPEGFSSGTISQENRHICAGTPQCSGWQEYARTCKCSPDTETRKTSCPSGLNGSYTEERKFDCLNGEDQPGKMGNWVEKPGEGIADKCTCDPYTETRTKSCPSGLNGTYKEERKFTCSNGPNQPGILGNWQDKPGEGRADKCTCTPYTQTRNRNCPSGLSGNYQQERKFTCSNGPNQPGILGNWQDKPGSGLADKCTCTPYTQTRNRNCPSGLSGTYKQQRKYTCSNGTNQPGTLSGWAEKPGSGIADSCTCTPYTQTRSRNCPGGLSGRYKQERNFTCPNGTNQPGTLSSWRDKPGEGAADNCICTPSSTPGKPKSCPKGLTGEIRTEIVVQCPSGNTVVRDVDDPAVVCKPPPPIICKWQGQSFMGSESNPLAIKHGDICGCGTQKGKSKTCSKKVGGQHKYGVCTCEPV